MTALASTLTTRLRYRTENLIGIADLARLGDGFRELSDTASEVCKAVTGLPGCDWVTIAWFDSAGGRLTTWGNSDAPRDFLAWAQSAERTRAGVLTPIFEAFTSGHEVVIPDVIQRPDQPRLVRAATAHGWRAAAYVPIVARGRTIGTLNCYSREVTRYQHDDIDLLHFVARSAGIALETSMISDRHRAELVATRVRVDDLQRSEKAITAELDGLRNEIGDLVVTQDLLAHVPEELAVDAVHAICAVLADKLGVAVMVWDLSGKPRAFAGPIAERSRIATAMSRKDPTRLAALTEPTTTSGGMRMYRIGHERSAAVVVFDPAPPDKPAYALLLQHALALLVGELRLERAERSARDIARPALLHALVRGNLSPRQAAAVGTMIDTAGQGFRVGIVRTPDDMTATAIVHQLNLSARGRGCVAASAERDGVLVLLESRPAAELMNALSALLQSVTTARWSVGMSGEIKELADAPRALEEASIAGSSAGAGAIALYERLGATASLLSRIGPDSAAGFVSDLIGPLVDFDNERKGALMRTLACYLHHRGSLKRAAAELGVHENTVQLRLGRASELLGMDLHSPEQLGLLAVALSWHRMLGGADEPR